jgi:hypothetical protein
MGDEDFLEEKKSASSGEIMNKERRSLLTGFPLILMIVLGMITGYASDDTIFGPQTTSGEPLWRLLLPLIT